VSDNGPESDGDGFTPYIGTIAEALAGTPGGKAALAYVRARYGPGAKFTHGYTSGTAISTTPKRVMDGVNE
jgi:hypothetical protein